MDKENEVIATTIDLTSIKEFFFIDLHAIASYMNSITMIVKEKFEESD